MSSPEEDSGMEDEKDDYIDRQESPYAPGLRSLMEIADLKYLL
jgi:hypothetical protein